MLTTLSDWPSLYTACTTWHLGAICTYPSTYTSLWWGAWKNTGVSIAMLPSYVNNCKKPSRKCKHSPYLRLRDRSDIMTGRLMSFHWRQVIWSWLKQLPTRGRGKWRTSGRRNHMKWNTKLLKVSLRASQRISGWDAHESSTKTYFFS